jgi:glycosyltransferase involved in cell wall biosynthesis
MRLLILTRQFATDGAERQLIALLHGIDKRRFQVTVVSFYEGGGLAEEVRGIEGIRWISLGKRGRWDVTGFLLRLRKVVRDAQPDVFYGYMGFCNTLAVLYGKVAGARIVWAVRASDMKESEEPDRLHRFSYWCERRLARYADLIIANSRSGKTHVVSKGYPEGRTRVIHNEIDTTRFSPAPLARRELQEQWGIGPTDKAIGLVAHVHPMKDHANFIEAAQLLAARRSDLKFLCIGANPAGYGDRLRHMAENAGLAGRLLWVPEQRDVAAVNSALDIACSVSAYGEGFSNAVAEAMACGTPCVVTDVGNSVRIVGDLGEVVPPRNPAALADAIERLLARVEREGEAFRALVRMRVEQHFSVEQMVARTEEALAELANQGSAACSGVPKQ